VDVAADLAFKVTFQNGGRDFPGAGDSRDAHGEPSSEEGVHQDGTVSSIDTKETTTVTFTNLQLPPSTFGAQATVNVVIGKFAGEVTALQQPGLVPGLLQPPLERVAA